jgi:hypothetical protein
MIRLALIVIALTGLASTADAEPAGFMLQPAIAVGTSIQGGDTTSSAGASAFPRESFTFVPALRFGVQVPHVGLLAFVSYSTAGVQGQVVDGFARVGVLAEPVIWRSADTRARIYLLAGVGAVIVEASAGGSTTTTPSTFTKAGATLQLGVGGRYDVHPSFGVGLEILAQPDLVPLDGNLYVASEVLVAITGTFVTGHRSFPTH